MMRFCSLAGLTLAMVGLVTLAGCSSGPLPVAENSEAISEGRPGGGPEAGAADSGIACACPNGETACPIPCADGQPGECVKGKPVCGPPPADAGSACACPKGETTCPIPCPDGQPGQCVGGKPECGSPVPDAGVCVGPAPLCFGNDSQDCCGQDPEGSAVCEMGRWMCGQAVAPGCNGTLCGACVGSAPLCFGNDSQDCCGQDPEGQAVCEDGAWMCGGAVAPGCDGISCF